MVRFLPILISGKWNAEMDAQEVGDTHLCILPFLGFNYWGTLEEPMPAMEHAASEIITHVMSLTDYFLVDLRGL